MTLERIVPSGVFGRAIALVDRDIDGEPAWLAKRTEGVTATEVARLIGGGIKTRRSILDGKEGGDTFRGNAHTERGHRREVIIAEWVSRRFNIHPSAVLWGHVDNPLYMATPDGIGINFDEELLVSEIKSTEHDWSVTIPRNYLDQVQWQLFVTGAVRALFVWERVDELGQPYDLEPTTIWIPRDEQRIAELKAAADSFIAWRAAGAPTVDADIDEELDEAISRHVKARALKAQAEADEKAAEKDIRAAIEKHGKEIPWKVSGSDGEFNYSVTKKPIEALVVDGEAFRKAHPTLFRRYGETVVNAAALREEKPELFEKFGSVEASTSVSTRLVVAAHTKPEAGDE